MPSRSRSPNRCPRCRINQSLCVCLLIDGLKPQVRDLTTRVVVIMHYRERKLTSNTAQLMGLALDRFEIRVRGEIESKVPTEGLVEPGRASLLLYPSDDAVELTPEYVAALGKPVTLIVPDGSWRQARKVAGREPGVAGIPRVKLPESVPSSYRLRREPNERSVSTFEAIARALGLLEGPARGKAAQDALEHLFEVWVERSLWGRGMIRAEECRHPIPREAFEAFKRAGARGGEKAKRLLEERRAAGLTPSKSRE